MSFKISLDPSLEIPSSDFVDAWNENPQHADVAKAELQNRQGGLESFDPTLAQQLMPVLVGLAGALATNALYDLLKAQVLSLLEERNQPASLNVLNITEVPQPDGSKLLVITYDID